MTDVTTAATIASLRAEVDRLKAELADMTKNRDECAAVFWIDRDHQTRGPVDQCGCPSCVLHLVYRDKNAKELADRNAYAERLLAENVRLSNEAATARERAGVLRAEVRAWRNASDNYTGDVRIVYGQAGHIETIAAARAETDRTHALDAAKFGGAT